MKIYPLIISQALGKRLGRTFEKTGAGLAEFFPALKSDLVMAAVDMSAEEYLVASLISSVMVGMLVFTFVFLPLVATEAAPGIEAPIGLIPAILLGFIDFIALIKYPRILAKKRSEMIERDLIYALKDLLLNVSAGINIFGSIKRVADGGHGIVSEDLKKVVEDVNRGTPMDDALEQVALSTSSEYMRNSIWQIINSFKAGTSVKEALSSIVEALIRDQKRKIQNYIQELNVLTLVYMLFAVAVPTIFTTLLVVLTSLMGTGVSEEQYAMAIIFCILIQIMLVSFIKSRRPMVYIN
jgi:flagellar protein FlaJ